MTRLSVDHRATAARLREQPGVWQPVGSYSTPTSAQTTASLIRIGGHSIGAHYRPDGAYEARTRSDADGVAVEARYVGGETL